MSFFDKVKKAGKSMVNTGSKAMLKADIVFLEREIKNIKQRFGVEVYELMEQLEIDTELSVEDKETKIRLAFDRARKDIAVIQAKIDCKKEEVSDLEGEEKINIPNTAITAQQTVTNHIMMTAHPSESTEMEHGLQK